MSLPKSVLIIGYGRMGRVHASALQALGIQTRAVVDPKVTADDLGPFTDTESIELYDDLSKLPEKANYDFVSVATTTIGRVEIIEKIIDLYNPKFILIEKPVARSLKELLTLESLQVNNPRTRIAVNHQMRFMSQYSWIKTSQWVPSLGPLISMNVSGANFGLAMNVTHYFEAFRYLTGSAITRVSGFIEPEKISSSRGELFSDYGGIILAKNDLNQSFFIDFSSGIGHGVISVYNFRNGKVVVNELGYDLHVFHRKDSFAEQPTYRYGLPETNFSIKIQQQTLEDTTSAVIASLLSGENYPDLEIGIHSTRCSFSALASSLRGGVEMSTLNFDFPFEENWP